MPCMCTHKALTIIFIFIFFISHFRVGQGSTKLAKKIFFAPPPADIRLTLIFSHFCPFFGASLLLSPQPFLLTPHSQKLFSGPGRWEKSWVHHFPCFCTTPN